MTPSAHWQAVAAPQTHHDTTPHDSIKIMIIPVRIATHLAANVDRVAAIANSDKMKCGAGAIG